MTRHISQIYWLNIPENYGLLFAWIQDPKDGINKQIEVRLTLSDLKNWNGIFDKIRQEDTVEFELAYIERDGENTAIAKDPIWVP